MQPLFKKHRQKRLLILGCGMLGTLVARAALRRGLHVTALTHNATQAATLRALGVQGVILADLATDDWHAQSPATVDYVLNSVSSGRISAAASATAADKLAARQRSYLDGMRSLMRWMAKPEIRVGTLVYTSSTGVYLQGGGVTLDETAPTAPPDTATRAGILVAAEHALIHGCAALVATAPVPPPRWFILRLAGLYGPGRTQLLDSLKNGETTGTSLRSSHRLNLIHLEDATAAIWAAFDASASIANRVYNVADDYPAPKRDVLHWLAAQIDAGANAQAANRGGGTAPRSVPDRLISNARLKRELGWRPRYPDYRSGYERMLSPSAAAAAC